MTQTDRSQLSATRRGWGPFSGAQLTIIIVAVILMILLPVGAFAVASGSNSFVTDATTGKHATVNANGQLATTVNGVVAATPSTFVRTSTVLMNATCTKLYAAPATRAVVFKTLIGNTLKYDATSGAPDVYITSDPMCAVNPARFVTDMGLPTGLGQGETQLDPGLVVPAGTSLYALLTGTGGGDVWTDFHLWGYSLPASVCQAPSTCS